MLAFLIAAAVAAPTPHAPAPVPQVPQTAGTQLPVETGMPRMPGYDPHKHVSIPMRADVHASLPPAARDAYAQVSYEAVITNSAYRACAKLNPKGIASRIDARRPTKDPVMGSIAVEVYAACY